VWLWSGIISAVLSVAVTIGIVGGPNPVAHSLQQCLILWACFTVLLTPVGVLAVFRETFDPGREFAERQRARQGFAENAPVAVATRKILTWAAKAFGRAGNGPQR
jgi:hypothetical protein